MSSDEPPSPTPDPECFGDQTFEDALEPLHLIRRSDAVLRAGVLMLGAGTSSLRVRQLMRRVARAVGLDEMQAQITFTDISLTVSRRGIFRTQIGEIASPGVNAHRIAMLHELHATLADSVTATEVDSLLDHIESTPRLYPEWLVTLWVALACASVAVLTGGGWREVVSVLPASAVSFVAYRFLVRRQVNLLPTVLAAAALATGGFTLLSALLDAALGGPSPRLAAGFVCAAIYLVPGFPLVTGGLDLTRIDLSAGLPRVTYAAMVMLSITIGVWIVSRAVGISPDPVPALGGPPVLVWLALVAASFFAVAGWATMFNSPLPMVLASGVIAVIANVPRLLLLQHGIANHVATFVGCVIIGLACHLAGVWFKMTKIIMTVPTMLVMIPGSSALRTLIYFDQADVVQAMRNAIATVLAVIAMVAGLSAARMLTDPEWAFTRPDPPELGLRALRRP
ncbi:MAG TPA: threonine/serine exporter family protein [Propionibacteriaceae bacterium]|nr:threonine/serine exporter family protein [Propionibacteriaceae bacterium]